MKFKIATKPLAWGAKCYFSINTRSLFGYILKKHGGLVASFYFTGVLVLFRNITGGNMQFSQIENVKRAPFDYKRECI